MAARVDGGERTDGDEARQVGGDHQPPAREPVGQRAADQQRRQQRDRLADEDDPELRRAGERERLPAERGHERRVADQRDELPGEEQPEVAVPERLERARASCRCGGAVHRAPSRRNVVT